MLGILSSLCTCLWFWDYHVEWDDINLKYLTRTHVRSWLGASSRGGGSLRGTRARGLVPYSHRASQLRGARLSSYHGFEEADDQGSSDDSTKPRNLPWEPPCVNTIPPPAPIREPSLVREQSPLEKLQTVMKMLVYHKLVRVFPRYKEWVILFIRVN